MCEVVDVLGSTNPFEMEEVRVRSDRSRMLMFMVRLLVCCWACWDGAWAQWRGLLIGPKLGYGSDKIGAR